MTCIGLSSPSFFIPFSLVLTFLSRIQYHRSLFDFTNYVAAHPMPTTPDISITGFKDIGFMDYPDSHPMSYFEDLKKEEGVKIRSLERYVYSTTSRVNQNARYGDKMVVDQFSKMVGISNDRINLLAVADDLGTMMLSNQVEYNRGGGTLVCGSPDEVAPDPRLDDYFDGLEADQACFGCQSSYVNYYQQKQTVWTMNVLEAEDQLCQRMSWALYEHLNVGITTAPDNTETNLYSYDILTRNCFGSYFDILKEMVYNPKIGEQFNSVGSTSARQKWDVHKQLVLPDENLGREIMQVSIYWQFPFHYFTQSFITTHLTIAPLHPPQSCSQLVCTSLTMTVRKLEMSSAGLFRLTTTTIS